MKTDYLDVTELSGDDVAAEQIQRLSSRYYWAGQYCEGKEVLEVACGTGQGLGYLAQLSSRIVGGDCSSKILDIARGHYGNRIELREFDAQKMPFEDGSFDVVILFEAIYYLASAEAFVLESKRILRSGGHLLIVTANKDLYDFNPSPYSHSYYGVVEMGELFTKHGFSGEFFGGTPYTAASVRQRILRPIKKLVVGMGLMPKSMASKKFLKKLVFGELKKMPAEIDKNTAPYEDPVRLPSNIPDRTHKVIYCAAHIL